MLLKKRTFSFFQASHFIIHSKNFVTISPRHVCSLQYICQQHNILTMKQQHDIKCKENLDKIRVADGIWTHDPPWSSLLDHGGSWVQIPSAARIFSEFSLHLITQHLKKVSWILLLKLSCVTRLMEKDFPRQSQLQKLYHKLNKDNPSIITVAKKVLQAFHTGDVLTLIDDLTLFTMIQEVYQQQMQKHYLCNLPCQRSGWLRS